MANVDLNEIGKRAKAAATMLAQACTQTKDKALLGVAEGLIQQQDAILAQSNRSVRLLLGLGRAGVHSL